MIVRVFLIAFCCLSLTSPARAEFTLTILHTNDVHGRFEPISASNNACSVTDNADGKCYGGTARLVTAVQEARENAANPVLVDGGDQFQGSLLFRQYKGKLAAELMNMLGYDVMTLGNHEFGSGPDALRTFIEKVRFPVLMANGDLSREPSLDGLVPASVVLPVAGAQIGFIGIVTENTANLAAPSFNVSFDPPGEAVRREVARLTARGIDKIVLLSHAGYAADLQLARDIDGIDVIVGGHSHTLLGTDSVASAGPYPTMVGNTAVVQAFAYGKYLGRLVVDFDENGKVKSAEGAPILMDINIRENQLIKARIAEASEPLEVLRRRVVGSAEARIGGGVLGCRAGECPLGNLVAEAMLAYASQQGADVALMNGGGLRSQIDAGPVSMEEVMTTLPFQNTLSTFKLSGRELKEALENGVSAVERGAGRFPQVAGMRYAFNPFAENGARIVAIDIAGEPLDPEREYTIVSNSFLRGGGDGYTVFRGARDAYDFGPDLAEVLAAYLTRNQPVAPITDGRIQIITD